jgi:hypothetical protein
VSCSATSNGLLVSDTDPLLLAGSPGPSGWAPALPPQAEPYLRQLRDALTRHAAGGSPDALESAFAAAGGVVASVASVRPGGRPDLDEMRRLAQAVPEFGAFLSCAADEAGRIMAAGTAGVWQALGLSVPPAAWTAGEYDAARMLFACALAPSQQVNPGRLRTGLRSLAAARVAGALAAQLTENEDPWVSALGDRYGSVRHRCAPRTAWRSRGLSDLLRMDEASRRAVAARLEQWLVAGGSLDQLAPELEAALVHARTPARFA